MRIIAMSLGTLIIVTVVSAIPPNSTSQSSVSQSISIHSADERESLIAIKLYQNKITSEIKKRAEKLIHAVQARPFHKKSPEDFLVLAKFQKAMELSLGYGLEPHNETEDKESQNF
jgi:hypothetical protein